MSSPFAKFKQAKPFRPQFNVGCLMDIATGRYEKGMKGENILNGGVAQIEGVTGPGNSFKSTIAHFRMLMVLFRYANAMGFVYDTENSATRRRFQDLANVIDPSGELAQTLEEEVGRFLFTDAAEYNGSEWWDLFKEGIMDRIKTTKMEDTPFLNEKEGKPYAILPPMIGEIDSFSQFQSNAVFEKTQKGTVGDGDLNPVAMHNAAAKAQLLDTLPYLASKAGFSMILTAHMGDTIVMDKYDGPKKKLSFVKANRKMKKTTEGFTFLTNNLFESISTAPLLGKKDKLPEFPHGDADDHEGNTDLMEITVLPIRTKGGITGYPFTLVASQRFGIQPCLTEYLYLKQYNRFGLTGNLVQQRLAIYPDVVFTRKSIRKISNSDPKFRRATEILSELCQINNLWPEYAQEFMVEPTELYEGLKKKGYDWDVLLSTRGYWTFDQYTHPVPFLSTKDLLEMYHGNYHPYWMKPL